MNKGLHEEVGKAMGVRNYFLGGIYILISLWFLTTVISERLVKNRDSMNPSVFILLSHFYNCKLTLFRLLVQQFRLMLCWNVLIFKYFIFRKVKGTGHNFIRRAIMELNQSPALENIEVSIQRHSFERDILTIL